MTRHRSLLATLLAGVLLASCATASNPLEIGFRRIALDLAFKDEELAAAIPAPEIITRIIPAEPVDFEPIAPRRIRVVRRIPPPVGPRCPVAPEGLAPERVAFAVVNGPPTEGVYHRHNEGHLLVQATIGEFEIPVPERSTWEITGVQTYRGEPNTGRDDFPQPGMPDAAPEEAESADLAADLTEFSITRNLFRGSSVTDTYRFNDEKPPPTDYPTVNGGKGVAVDDYLYLVRRVSADAGVETVFEPSPPIRVMRLNVPEGPINESGSVHAGMDPATNVAMSIQSQIVRRELVDVCGEMVDTYRVEIQEQMVDLASAPPEVSGNEGEAVNVWNVQIDNGLLIVRQEYDSTRHTTMEVLGQPVPVTVHYRFSSTLDSLEPEPLPEADGDRE